MAQHGQETNASVSPLQTGLTVALMAEIWILLVGGVHRDEMIVGAVCVAGAVAMFWLVARVRGPRYHITARDLASAWRLPWYVVQDLFLVVGVLFKSLRPGDERRAAFWVCGFKTSKRDPIDVGRRILVTIYSCLTPNMIVLGIEYEQSRILFHQLAPAGVNATMRDLGVRA